MCVCVGISFSWELVIQTFSEFFRLPWHVIRTRLLSTTLRRRAPWETGWDDFLGGAASKV